MPAHTASYYAASCPTHTRWPSLDSSIEADVCIIGGGFTGINSAIELAELGFSVVLLEAERIGWGASGRNGGQLIRGVGHNLEQFRHQLGDAGLLRLQTLGFEAVEHVRKRIDTHQIDCDLQMGYADLANTPKDFAHLQAEQAHLESLN